MIIAAASGWFIENLYEGDSALMAVKFRFNDLVLLTLITPLSVLMLILAFTGRLWARVFVLGIIMHVAFSYGITVFNSRQNHLFLMYIALLGLCVFSIVRGFPDTTQNVKKPSKSVLLRVTSVAIIFIAAIGFIYWLIEAVIAITNGGPSQFVNEMNLPVNAAQVLDMAFMLPLALYGGIKLWKYHSEGLFTTAVMLIFFMLIGISVVVMEIGLIRVAGLKMDFSKIASYSFISVLSLILTVFTYRFISRTTD
jgi:hypothetical protein